MSYPVSAVRSKNANSAAKNGLLNNLISYWPLNEASGNALDAHTNGLTLTDTNTVTSEAGHVYPTARRFTYSNNEVLVRPGDDALLSSGDVEITVAAWFYAASVNADVIVSKFNNAASQREYLVRRNPATNNVNVLFGNSDGSSSVTIAIPVAISIGQWYLVLAWHSPSEDTCFCSLNNGQVYSASLAGGVVDGSSPVMIGARFTFGAVAQYWDGRLGPVAIWKSVAGGGGVLDATKRDALWNAGAGLAYAAFTT